MKKIDAERLVDELRNKTDKESIKEFCEILHNPSIGYRKLEEIATEHMNYYDTANHRSRDILRAIIDNPSTDEILLWKLSIFRKPFYFNGIARRAAKALYNRSFKK